MSSYWIAVLLLVGAAAPAAAGSVQGQADEAGLASLSGIRSIPGPLLDDQGASIPAPRPDGHGSDGEPTEDEPLDEHGARPGPDTGGLDLHTAVVWLAPAGLIALAGVAVVRHRRPDANEGDPEHPQPPAEHPAVHEEDEEPTTEPFLANEPPPGVDGVLTVAQAHVDAGNLEEAVSWFEMAISIQPQLWVAHFCLGLALEGLRRDEEALEAFERTHELGALRPAPVYRQARVLARMGRSEDAFERLAQALQAEPELRSDAAGDPVFERFQDHPRFLALLGRI